MRVSYLYLLKSSVFPSGMIKLFASRASAKDIIAAHKDVYGGEGPSIPVEAPQAFPDDFDDEISAASTDDSGNDDQDSHAHQTSDITARTEAYYVDDTVVMSDTADTNDEGDFQIYARLSIFDIDLFHRTLLKIEPAFNGFLVETRVQTVRDLITSINNLVHLIAPVEKVDSKEIDHVDFIVSQENVGAFDEQEVGAYDSSTVLGSFFKTESIPLTRVFELTRQKLAGSKVDAGDEEEVLSNFKQFIIFNKGYAYVTAIFEEVFPEFNITVHDQFPSLDLAEDMLWYEIDRQKEKGDPQWKTCHLVGKIQSFFDCRPAKVTEPASASPIPGPSPRGGFTSLRRRPCVESGSSTRICDLVSDETEVPTAVSGTAPAFQISPSPCGNAFVTGVNLWNSDTRVNGPGAESVMIIKEFVAQMCHRVRGQKTQSSKLFDAYKEFHKARKPTEKPLSQGKFTVLMKQISLFENHRYNSAMYWVDMMVSAQPPANIDE